jgi:hypothetical protein
MSLVTILLFAPILFNGLRVSLAILAPVIGMLCTPFPRAVQADLTIFRIGLDSVAVIVRTPAALAVGVATHGLLRPVGGRLERLLTIATAASDRQRQHSFVCPLSKSLQERKTLESALEFLLLSPDGLKPMQFSAAGLMYFYVGNDTEDAACAPTWCGDD